VRKSRKEEVVAEFTAALQEAEHVILTDYRGLNVKEMTELRRAVREAGGRLRVMRNSLFLRALAGSEQSQLAELLIGPVAATFVSGDPATLLGAMTAFARRHEQLAFKGGWVDSRVYGAADMETLANLPPREELLATLLASLSAPVSQLAAVLQAIPRDLVLTLQALAAQKEEQAGAAASA
jgi:large subunit ribosomal protein L10